MDDIRIKPVIDDKIEETAPPPIIIPHPVTSTGQISTSSTASSTAPKTLCNFYGISKKLLASICIVNKKN
jgi:hypothetical protein